MEQVNKQKNINDYQSNNQSNNQHNNQPNNQNEFEKIESINIIQKEQLKPQFDFYKDFEMREILEKNTNEPNLNNENKEIEMMLNSFPIINDNLRANILLSIEIYKKINNFEMNYIHNIIDEKTKKNI